MTVKKGSKANRRHLMCISCKELHPLGDFLPTAVTNKYSRICPNCKKEQDRNNELLEEMGRDPDWLNYMSDKYRSY